jgi:hypothetical protein
MIPDVPPNEGGQDAERQFGLTVPSSFLSIADEVIE